MMKKGLIIVMVDIYYKYISNNKEVKDMMYQTAKLFMNGRSQAVRLPKEFRFEGDKVVIRKEGDRVILSAKPKSWMSFFKDTPLPSDDFMKERIDLEPQKRDGLS